MNNNLNFGWQEDGNFLWNGIITDPKHILDKDMGNVDFTYANLDGADLSNGFYSYADFSNGSLQNVNFSSSSLNGANLTSCNLTHSNLAYSNFNYAKMTGAILHQTNLTGTTFIFAILTYAKFDHTGKNVGPIASTNELNMIQSYGTNISGGDFTNANLVCTTWNKSNLTDIVLKYADLSGSEMLEVNLTRANLHGANISNADFTGSNLTKANFSATKTTQACFDDCNMKDTILDLSQINFGWHDMYIHIDERLATQRLYHLLRNVKFSHNLLPGFKEVLLTPELIELANTHHNAERYGLVTKIEEI